MALQDALADMQSKVGQETMVGEWLDVTQKRINGFADATGDQQWIHVDVERAKAESPFGGPIAHGYLTLSMIPVLTESVNPEKPLYPDLKMGVNYGLNKVRFTSPVPAGARVRARVTLHEVEEVKGNGIQYVNLITIEIEGQEKPACVAETVTRLYF